MESRSYPVHGSIRKELIQIATLIVLAVATFGPVLSNQFFSMDDSRFIEDNEIEYPLDANRFFEIFRRTTLGLYIPVPNIAWSLISKYAETNTRNPARLGFADYPNQRFDPSAFHAVSLVCHIFTGVLLFLCLVLMRFSSWGAFFGAAVFLFSPLQIEILAWAALLKDLLAIAFSLLALLLYLIYAGSNTKRVGRLFYALATVSYLLALGSKPGAIMLPLIIGLIGSLCLKRPLLALVREMAFWALCAIPIMIVTSNVQLADAAAQFKNVDDYLRPLIALDALGFYLLKLIAPLELAFDYGRSPSQALNSSWVYVSWIPACAIGVLIFANKRKYSWLVVSYGVFLLGLLPTLGFKTFAFQTYSTVTDHYLSLSMLGVAIGVAGAVDHQSKKKSIGITTLIVGFAILGALCIKSHLQLNHWTDSHAIYERAIDVNPHSWISYLMLGLGQQINDHPDRALEYYRKSMSINGNTHGHSELFASLYAANDFPRAYRVISDVVDAHHRDTDYFTRAEVSFRLARVEDAIRDLRHASKISSSTEMSARIDHALQELEGTATDR